MDVLKPEVYWIGNRCYRVNPCPSSQSQHLSYSGPNDEVIKNTASVDAQKPYVEVDEFEDAVTSIEDESTADNVEIVKEDNGYKIQCNVPSSLFPHIIGSKGAVKKRVEMETRTRIYVPRQNEKGDIVVRAQTEKDVRKGYKRIQHIAQNARFKREITHFVCFPLNDAAVVRNAHEFREKILKDCGKSRGLDQSIFQQPEKLHLTISVLVLLDERERQSAADILTSMERELKELMQGKSKLKIRLKGLEIMNDDPTQVDVLYAKCEPVEEVDITNVQSIADLVAKTFAEKGLGMESRGESVKLHCTLVNTKYRNENANTDAAQENLKKGYSPRESFDARSVLKNYGDFEFGIVEISEVKIATRRTTASDGFYKCYTKISV